MDQQSKQQILDKLAQAKTILVGISQSSGFDGLACGLALALSLIKLGKNVSIHAQSPSVDQALKLYGVDKIGKKDNQQNLVIVIENAVQNVDKVSYYLDDSKLKIFIHPLPDSRGASKEEISYEYTALKPDLVFAIGYNSQDELKTEITLEQKLDSQLWIISINNATSNQKFAQIEFINPDISTISELVTQFIQVLALPVSEDIAYNLYSGISYQTNNFSPAQTRTTTFQAAEWLIKFGAGKASFAKTDTSIRADKTGFTMTPDYQEQPIKPMTIPAPSLTITQIPDVEK